MITEEKDIPRKSYDEILKYVKDVCKKNENKYMRLTNFTRDHYLNYLKRVLKDNFKVYNEKEKYINNFNYDDMEYDKLFMEIAKEMEEKASRACMILEPYRFEMLRMIYEINCNSSNFQLSFNVSRLEQLHNHTDSSYCESNNCSQFKIHNVYKDMEKLFNEHSINDSLNIDNLVNQYNNNTNVVTNTTDAIKSSTNCSNIVPSFETTDDLFIEQFLYYMENNENVNLKFNQKDEHNQKYWYSEMLYQRRLFKNALSKIKYVSNIDNHKSSLNTYQKILDTIYEIFGSSSDVEDYDYEDEDDNNISFNFIILMLISNQIFPNLYIKKKDKYVRSKMLSNNYLIDLKKKTVLNECNSQNNSNDLKSKSSKTCCRLIWCCYCCCCRNCYLHVFHNQNNSCSKILDEIQSENIPRRIESNNLLGFIENDLEFSLDEVKSWKLSFDNLMNSNVGRNVFRDFLRYEYSEENMAFWLACEEFKKMSINDPSIEEKTKAIYDEFISVLSSREVSLDSKVREIINKDMRSPTISIFNEAQLQIFTLMQRDSYPRFLNSHIYKSILNDHFNNNGNNNNNNDGDNNDDNVQVINS